MIPRAHHMFEGRARVDRSRRVRVEMLQGDVRELARSFPENTFDAVLCDPPYGLRFMSRRWDYSVPTAALWAEVLRICKPGAHLLACQGPRTAHRGAVAIEDGGFEIRDSLAWLYGSGFPKSLDVAKALRKTATAPTHTCEWDGHGTALKPAHEPIVLARKPLDGTVIANVTRWGVGALAIDDSRIGPSGGTRKVLDGQGAGPGVNTFGDGLNGSFGVAIDGLGRWPANVLLDAEAATMLDAQAGERRGMSGGGKHRPDYAGGMFGSIDSTRTARGDTGGASRFFQVCPWAAGEQDELLRFLYAPKASRRERDTGLDGLAERAMHRLEDAKASTHSNRRCTACGRVKFGKPHCTCAEPAWEETSGSQVKNHHPTVKPRALTKYLGRMIRPPRPKRLLVPFSGSGSEILGAIDAGWTDIVGIELDADYIAIARARLHHELALRP